MLLRVIGIGAGGHARVLLETLRFYPEYLVVGLLDPNPDLTGRQILGTPVLGTDELLPDLFAQGIEHFFIGVGSVGDNSPRRRLYELCLGYSLTPVNAIHPSAVISPSAMIGRGAAILVNAVVNTGAILGENVIVNTAAVVEHDCIIGDHVHIATGARLASTVRVGAGAHIGVGATVRQSVTIGENALVGAGAAVVKDVAPWTTVIGVPARPVHING